MSPYRRAISCQRAVKLEKLRIGPKGFSKDIVPLGVRQTSNVLSTIDRVRQQGVGVVFISHNVRHAMAVGDRFTVLNRGQTLGTAVKGEISSAELQDLMAGGQELAELEGSLGGTI